MRCNTCSALVDPRVITCGRCGYPYPSLLDVVQLHLYQHFGFKGYGNLLRFILLNASNMVMNNIQLTVNSLNLQREVRAADCNSLSPAVNGNPQTERLNLSVVPDLCGVCELNVELSFFDEDVNYYSLSGNLHIWVAERNEELRELESKVSIVMDNSIRGGEIYGVDASSNHNFHINAPVIDPKLREKFATLGCPEELWPDKINRLRLYLTDYRAREQHYRQLHINEEIGRYRIIGHIGAGGMGEVWEVCSSYFAQNQTLALKVLNREAYKNPRVRKVFMREAMSGMAFQHPGVTRTVDTIEEDGVLGFLAPFYRGMTLRKLINERIGKLKEGEVPQQPIFALPEIVSILTRVCEAVHYVHTYHKLCHLDLKPENVLITNVDNLDKLQLGDLVVMDFGLSKSLDRKTRSSMYLSGGTLAYMAPEQAEGQQKSRGTWTDVHAMGMILFECCTGTAVMGKKIRYPSDRWPKHIPSTVDELIAASIEDEPSERIQTVAEFSEKLTKTLSKSKPKSGPKSKPITPIPEVIKNQILPNVMGKVTKAASRPLWQFWALGGVLVSMLLLLLLWFAMPTECKSGEVRACGTSTDVGECRKGQERCAGGKWSGVCEGERKARAEVCNGRDDDCDGVIDNNAQCPSGQLCSNGKCSCVAGTRQIMEIGGTSIAVRCIPAGSFMMGSPDNEPGRDSNEGPQRRVELTRPFWMMETEVTQGQYQRLMGYNPSAFKNCGANCPVEQVNWHEACAYANALARNQELEECYTCSGSGRGVTCEVKSQYRGSGYYNCKGWRLPTEAEWEYAYRGGTNTPFYTGRCISTEQANYNGNYPQEGCPKGQYRERTIAVGSLNAPNAWGLHDMAGNVWEWVHDWYQDSYRNLTGKDPVNDRTGSRRVLRGGSCYNLARIVRAAGRSRWSPADRYFGVGFRLLRADLSSN